MKKRLDKEKIVHDDVKSDVKEKASSGQIPPDIIRANDIKKHAEEERRKSHDKLISAIIDRKAVIVYMFAITIIMVIFTVMWGLNKATVVAFILLYGLGLYYRKRLHDIQEQLINIEEATNLVRKIKRQLMHSKKEF
ncbi:MAG TPA: hypothetical protein PK350_08340 [Deltaproteobacteria bacterium]|nr:hypothetical protein [Deltaproteobacteria bacterium]